MRDFKGMKRQRNRGRGGGGGKPQHNANRAFDSNGPDGVKVRGAAQHIYEKYQQLARDASSSGDRVLAENYLQHAEHYFRVLRAMQPQRPIGEIIGRDQFVSGYDIDFEEEPQVAAEETPEAEAEGQPSPEGRRDERRDDRNRDDRRDRWRDDGRPQGDFRRDDRQQGEFRPRDDRPRDDRQRDDYRQRDDRGPRDERGEFRARDERRDRDDYRQRDDRGPRDDRGEFRPREDRYRDDRQGRFQGERQGRYQGERRPDRDFRPERDPLGVIEPQATPLTAPAASAPAEPTPPAGYEPGDAGVLRSEDGAMSHAPAFLQARTEPGRAEAGSDAGEARRPRRRRAPRSFEASETTSDSATADTDEN